MSSLLVKFLFMELFLTRGRNALLPVHSLYNLRSFVVDHPVGVNLRVAVGIQNYSLICPKNGTDGYGEPQCLAGPRHGTDGVQKRSLIGPKHGTDWGPEPQFGRF